jgi:hypothetical protein
MFGKTRELDEVEEAVRAKLVELADQYNRNRIELWERGDDRADYSPPGSPGLYELLDDPVMYKESWSAVLSLRDMGLIKLRLKSLERSGHGSIWDAEVTQATRTGYSRVSGCWVWALIIPIGLVIWKLFQILDVLAGVADFFERVKNFF